MEPNDANLVGEEAHFWYIMKEFEDLFSTQPEVVIASLDRGVLSKLVDVGITRLRC